MEDFLTPRIADVPLPKRLIGVDYTLSHGADGRIEMKRRPVGIDEPATRQQRRAAEREARKRR